MALTLAPTLPHRRQLLSASAEKKSSYRPQLDGLRALAILGILLEHFGVPLPSLLRCGPLGVRFFFVLSGFFITLSLWRMQTRMAKSEDDSVVHLLRFYGSRLLRIGPPFYLALGLGALFGIEEVRTNFLWLATFQANNYYAYVGYFPDAIAHFWSLAVQEQFYLLWPLLVLTLPRRWFIPAMAGFILFGLAFRLFCIVADTSTMLRWVTLLSCVDSFAIGAVIAYCKESRLLEKIPMLSRDMLVALPLIAFSCFFAARVLMTLPLDNRWVALTESLDGVFLAWLLVSALAGGGRYHALLSWAPLVYLGKISYGIYVYHVFVIVLVSPLLLTWGMSETHYDALRLSILFLLTVALASLSWHWLEQPFLAWKKSLETRDAAPRPIPEGSFSLNAR